MIWITDMITTEDLARVAKERHELYLERFWIENDNDGFTGWRWDKYNVQLKIVCAANRFKDYIILGTRHWAIDMWQQADLIGKETLDCYSNGEEEQGFIDQYGTFHSRKEAAKIAIAAGQVRAGDLRGGILFSEDLY